MVQNSFCTVWHQQNAKRKNLKNTLGPNLYNTLEYIICLLIYLDILLLLILTYGL